MNKTLTIEVEDKHGVSKVYQVTERESKAIDLTQKVLLSKHLRQIVRKQFFTFKEMYPALAAWKQYIENKERIVHVKKVIEGEIYDIYLVKDLQYHKDTLANNLRLLEVPIYVYPCRKDFWGGEDKEDTILGWGG